MNKLPLVKVLFDRHNKASRFQKGSIEIEIYYRDKRKRVTLPISILKSQWKNGVVINHPSADAYNAQITSICQELDNSIHEMHQFGSFDIQALCNTVKSMRFTSTNTFIQFLESRIGMRAIRNGTRKQHRIILNKLICYGQIICFQDLTRPNIKRFDDWLRTQGLSKETIHGYHKNMKTYIHEAIEYGYVKEDPYKGLRISREHSNKIKYLLDDERGRVEGLVLEGTTELVRDMFVFGSYTSLAFSDIAKIKKSDFYSFDGKLYLEDKRIKTGTPYKLTILPPAVEILEKYGYHFPRISNQTANNHLKIIGALAKTRHKLTTHMARHTFGTWALRKGIPIEIVSKMMAHSSITQTLAYAKVLQLSVDEGFEMLAGKLNKGKLN